MRRTGVSIGIDYVHRYFHTSNLSSLGPQNWRRGRDLSCRFDQVYSSYLYLHGEAATGPEVITWTKSYTDSSRFTMTGKHRTGEKTRGRHSRCASILPGSEMPESGWLFVRTAKWGPKNKNPEPGCDWLQSNFMVNLRNPVPLVQHARIRRAHIKCQYSLSRVWCYVQQSTALSTPGTISYTQSATWKVKGFQEDAYHFVQISDQSPAF